MSPRSPGGLEPLVKASAKDLQRRWGEVADQALSAPVVITSNGRPRHVLMGVAEYQRMAARTRQSHLVRDLPEPLAAALEEGLDALAAPDGTPEGDDVVR